MRLLCYLDEEKKLFTFDNEYTYSLKHSNNLEILMKKNINFIKDFYGNNINLTAIVGQNGTGKTYVLNNIFNLSKDKGIFFFEDDGEIKYYGNKKVYSSEKNVDLSGHSNFILFECPDKDIKIVEIEKNEIKVRTLFFSNSIEGKNLAIKDLFIKNNDEDLSILKNIFHKPYNKVLKEKFLKQISMIRDLESLKTDLFPNDFFNLPEKFIGTIIVPSSNFNFEDMLLKNIIFGEEQYSRFKLFCTSFFQDKSEKIRDLSIWNNVAMFSALTTYGLKFKDIFYILNNSSEQRGYIKNLWSFLNKCLGTEYGFNFNGFVKVNKIINELIEIERKTNEKIEKINIKGNLDDSNNLTDRELEIVLEHRSNFKIEFIKSRNDESFETEIKIEESIDIISITGILVYIWKYILTNEILNMIDNVNETEHTISFEIEVKNNTKLVDLLMLDNSSIILEYSWDRISSGENYLLNLFSEIYRYGNKHSEKKNIIICIDEVDLGLHPEWQRKWVQYSLKIINYLLNPNSDFSRYIQIIITTHSPIILSDFLSYSVQLITSKGLVDFQFKTFGTNIHELMAESFFLEDGVVGEFAKNQINSIIANLTSEKKIGEQKLLEFKYLASEIGEPLVRNHINNLIASKDILLNGDIDTDSVLNELSEIKHILKNQFD